MMRNSRAGKTDTEIWRTGVLLLGFIIFIGVLAGPKGCSRRYDAWKASSYGSDWLVIRYNAMGKPVDHWELKNKSVGNEQDSDGIFFVDNDGIVVHLGGGAYGYYQVHNGAWDKARARYLKLEK
jgi:hypothetical protein